MCIRDRSDTTNLAAAVAETGLFDHVTAMVSSTGPTLVIALILYTIMGLNIDASAYDPTVAQSIQDAFRGAFVISPVLLIPIIVVIVMCILRVPGLVGIAISVATATIFMMIFQPTSIYGSRALGDIFNTLHYGIGVETGNEVADSSSARPAVWTAPCGPSTSSSSRSPTAVLWSAAAASVSYTHLDVYKRQLRISAHASLADNAGRGGVLLQDRQIGRASCRERV